MDIILRVIRKIEFIFTKNPYKIAELHRKYGVNLGKDCQIYGGVNFGSEPYLIELGDRVKITANNQFITHDGGIHVLRNLGLTPNGDRFGRITVGNNVFIGIGCIIMPGVSIGDNVIIGAGSVVTKDIPDNIVAAGVPCKCIKSIDNYYEDIKNKVDYTKHLDSKKKKQFLMKKFLSYNND